MKIIIGILGAAVIVSILFGCNAYDAKYNNEYPPNLYIYNRSSILKIAKKFGFQDNQIQDISTNQSGTKIIIREFPNGVKGRIFIFSKGKQSPDIIPQKQYETLLIGEGGTPFAWRDERTGIYYSLTGDAIGEPRVGNSRTHQVFDKSGVAFIDYSMNTQLLKIALVSTPNQSIYEETSKKYFLPISLVYSYDKICWIQESYNEGEIVLCVLDRVDGKYVKSSISRVLLGRVCKIDMKANWIILSREIYPLLYRYEAVNLSTGGRQSLGLLLNKVALFLEDRWFSDYLLGGQH